MCVGTCLFVVLSVSPHSNGITTSHAHMWLHTGEGNIVRVIVCMRMTQTECTVGMRNKGFSIHDAAYGRHKCLTAIGQLAFAGTFVAS